MTSNQEYVAWNMVLGIVSKGLKERGWIVVGGAQLLTSS
jgi:hypothetical protein